MPNNWLMKRACCFASPFATHRTLPFRIMCTASIPCKVLHAVAKELVLALMVPPAAISTVLAPRMARLGAHAIRTYLLYVVGLTAAILVPLGAAMAVLGTPLITLVFGSRYALAATVVPLLVLGMVCYGLYLVLATSWAWGLGRPQIDPAATAVAMVVTVTLGLMLVPGAGLLGAAFAYTAGAVSQLAVIGGFTVWAVFAGATPRLGPARELVLETERLRLRPFRTSDAKALHALYGDRGKEEPQDDRHDQLPSPRQARDPQGRGADPQGAQALDCPRQAPGISPGGRPDPRPLVQGRSIPASADICSSTPSRCP